MQVKQHPYLIQLNKKYQIIQTQILKIRIKNLDLDDDGQVNFDQQSSDTEKLSRVNAALHRLDPQKVYFDDTRSLSGVLKYMMTNHATPGKVNISTIEGLDTRLDYWITGLQVESWHILHDAEQAFEREQGLLKMFGKCVDAIEFSSASMAINYHIKPAFFIRDSQFYVTKLARRLTTSEQLKSTPKTKKRWFKNERFLVQYRPLSIFDKDDFYELSGLAVPYLCISHKSRI